MLADYASLQPYNVHACPTNILIDARMSQTVRK